MLDFTRYSVDTYQGHLQALTEITQNVFKTQGLLWNFGNYVQIPTAAKKLFYLSSCKSFHAIMNMNIFGIFSCIK